MGDCEWKLTHWDWAAACEYPVGEYVCGEFAPFRVFTTDGRVMPVCVAHLREAFPDKAAEIYAEVERIKRIIASER